MSDSSAVKNDSNALEEMNVKQLLLNLRLNLEKTRSRAERALSNANSSRNDVNELILAIDRIKGRYDIDIHEMTGRLAVLEEMVSRLSQPWYRKLWNWMNDRRSRQTTTRRNR